MLSQIFKDHQVSNAFAGYDFNFLLMTYSAYFLKNAAPLQQKRLSKYFSKWFERVKIYREGRVSYVPSTWHDELPDKFITKYINSAQHQFKVTTVKGLLMAINKIFDTHRSHNK